MKCKTGDVDEDSIYAVSLFIIPLCYLQNKGIKSCQYNYVFLKYFSLKVTLCGWNMLQK